MTPAAPFTFGDFGHGEHVRGDEHCADCWPGSPSPGWPHRCIELVNGAACGGLVHAQFGEEFEDGGWWLETKCERCGAVAGDTDAD